MKNIPDFFVIRNREEWHDWLELNHNVKKEVWISIFKKKHAEKGIIYEKAVEEAICYGWIDGMMKSLDDEKFILRFSPRRKNSPWSLINKNRAEKMIREGKMRDPGIAIIEEAKKNGWWEKAYSLKTKPEMPLDLAKALKSDKNIWKLFAQLSNSDQTRYIFWINQAKQQGTRERRIKQLIIQLDSN